MMNKTLLFFTSSFPFGSGEQFIETEILFLSKAFKKIYIFPISTAGVKRTMPENVKIVEVRLYTPYKTITMLIRNAIFLAGLYFNQLLISPNRFRYILGFKKHFRYLLHRSNDAEQLFKELQKFNPSSIVIYSYWFNLWATLLVLLKKQKKIKHPIITRAHGGDLDVFQKKEGYFLFRSTEMQEVDVLLPVSDYGKNIILKNYSSFRGQLAVARLGVAEIGNNPFSPDKGLFHLVSCSFFYPLKRIHLIIEILFHLKIKVKWTHFGEGDLLESIKELAKNLPPNILVDFRGMVPNNDILDFYKTTPVDLFINTSELEGIPVSIMEAISFGIPSMGCNICGVPEIVNSETGFLLPKEFDPKVAANIISEYLCSPVGQQIELREKAKNFWRKNFNAEINYPEFINKISS